MTAYIGYNNILETGTVTVTSEQTDYPKENAYDWLPYDWWIASSAGTVYLTVDMGSATTVDYWALAFHDLADNSGTIKPQYTSGSTSPFSWSDLDTVQTPTAGQVIFRPVTSVNVRYFRFEITSTGSPSYIGALALGQALTLQRAIKAPLITPTHARDRKILNSTGESGNFLGRSIERSYQDFEIKQSDVTAAWISSNWEGLADHIELKPFFYLHSYENAPTEAAFAWAERINYPKYNSNGYLDFSINCRGKV